MIIYDPRRRGGFAILFHHTGSALFHVNSLPMALLSGILAAICSEVVVISDFLTGTILSNSAFFGGLSFIVSFVVVYRAQMAIQRYNSAQETYFKMISLLCDLAMFLSVSVDIQQENDKGVKAKKILFINSITRWSKVYIELATEQIQGFEFSPRYPRTTLTPYEAHLVSRAPNKPLTVMGWIVYAVRNYKVPLDVPDGVFGRVMFMSSDINTLFNETRRISETPFPFPFTQITMMMITFWALTVPAIMVPNFSGTYIGAALIAFFGTWMLFAVNEAASQLEQPFDEAENDLPVLNYSLTSQEHLNAIATTKFPDIRQPSAFPGGRDFEFATAAATGVPSLKKIETYKKLNKRNLPAKAMFEMPARFKSATSSLTRSSTSVASDKKDRKSQLFALFNLERPKTKMNGSCDNMKHVSEAKKPRTRILTRTFSDLTYLVKPNERVSSKKSKSEGKSAFRPTAMPVVQPKATAYDTISGATSQIMLSLLKKELSLNFRKRYHNHDVHFAPKKKKKKKKPRKRTKTIDEKTPFSHLRRQGLFDRIR